MLKSSMEDLHAEHLTELKAVQSSQKEIVYVMKQLSASDREKKLLLNLKRSVELDYDLHVRDNIKAWTAEYCKSCRSIRSIMSQYEGQDNPVLATEIEEKRLLRHLNKITKRAERTAEEDEIIRRGYFKVIHRVLDSLSTMDHRDEMDRLHLKRTVQYICTRLVDFWNSGVPVIKSFYRDGEVRLISSQGWYIFYIYPKLLLILCLILHWQLQLCSKTCGHRSATRDILGRIASELSLRAVVLWDAKLSRLLLLHQS